MAKLFSYAIFLLLLLSTISLLFSFSSAKVICEKLPREVCSFSISSTSNRCILESSSNQLIGEIEYQCKTSDVMVQRMSDYIESDQCVQSCGVERNTVGISSDSLLDSRFTSKICSASCYQNCPNIVDLYFNLAAGEGVFLPKLCEENRMNPHRAMAELLSSGEALAPESSSAPEGSTEAQSPGIVKLGPAMSRAREEAQSPGIVKLGPAMSRARKLLSLLDADAPESFGEDLAPAHSPARSLLTSAEATTPESSGEELGPAFEPLAPSTPLDFDLFNPPAPAPAPWPQ